MEGEAHHTLPYLKEAIIFLVAAGVVVPILQRFGLNPILGYLVAGVVVGPHGIVTLADSVFGIPLSTFAIAETEGVSLIAELGVVFLLFLIGLELSGPRLWAMRGLVFGVGGIQVVATAAAITGAAILMGLTAEAAIAIGAALALSSTAIVVQLLVQAGRLASPPGQVMFGILLMQDIAVVPVLLVIGSLGSEGEGGLLQSLATSILLAAVIVTAILFAGRRVLAPVFRFVGARRDRDMFTAAALLVIIGTAAATQFAGLSMTLGAFMAGLVFADTEFAHQLEAEIAPFKGLLLGLFFLSVGMAIDPRVVVDAPLALAAVIFGIIALKAAIVFVIVIAAGRPIHVALEAGLMLSQIGEFSLVALALASATGVVPTEVARVFVVAAGITMLLTSALAPSVRRLAGMVEARRGDLPANTLEESGVHRGHVIIAGFGRIGRAIGELMEDRRVPYLALDLNAHSVARARAKGMPVHFGDLRRSDVLELAKASEARAIVLTMNDPKANAAVIDAVRRLGIDTPVVARAHDAANATELYALGADEVVLEAFEASLQMGEETLVALGFPRDAAHSAVGETREEGRRLLMQARPRRTPSDAPLEGSEPKAAQ